MMKKALLVIDFINDIVHPDGKIPSCASHVQEQNAIPHTNQALAYARKNDWLVILVKVGFESHYYAQPKNSPIFGLANQYKALQLGCFGTEFHDDLDVQTSDFIIEKPRISPFYGTPLEAVLRANRIEHVYLTGVSTTLAIQSTTRDAHDRDYKVTIIEDACAADSQQTHQQSIELLSRLAEVISVEQLTC